MLLCGLTTKNTPVFSELTSPFVQIGGNRPAHPEFEPRTLWSLTNAFTSAFKELDPIPVHGELPGSSGYRSLVQASTVPPPPVQTEISW
jgi:hypothetical protein